MFINRVVTHKSKMAATTDVGSRAGGWALLETVSTFTPPPPPPPNIALGDWPSLTAHQGVTVSYLFIISTSSNNSDKYLFFTIEYENISHKKGNISKTLKDSETVGNY